MSAVAMEGSYSHVTRDAAVSGGQPIVAGTRIPIATLVRAHQLGMDFDEILVQFPSLRPVHLHAALVYDLDHRDEVDALLRQADSPPSGADVVG